jgi:hypothetical protein
MVIFLLLSLTFFVHARSWYTFAAYESTMLAASEGRLSVEKGEAAAQSRMEWWISQIPLPAEPVTVQTECREKEIQIKAEGNILPIWSRNAWEYSVLSESRRNNPVKTIRKINGKLPALSKKTLHMLPSPGFLKTPRWKLRFWH